jgi:hypothetical protein
MTKAREYVRGTIEQFDITSEDIKGYIKLKLFVDDETKWNEIKDKIVLKQMKYFDICTYIYDSKVEPDPETLAFFKDSSNWFLSLNKAKTEAISKLDSMRPGLQNEQKIKTQDLKATLAKKKIDEFDSLYDLDHSSKYFEVASAQMNLLEELATKAAEYEEDEFYLNIPNKTDFFEVYKTKNAFKKYYNLWDFIYDKWHYVIMIFLSYM